MEVVALIALIVFLYWREEQTDQTSPSIDSEDRTESRY